MARLCNYYLMVVCSIQRVFCSMPPFLTRATLCHDHMQLERRDVPTWFQLVHTSKHFLGNPIEAYYPLLVVCTVVIALNRTLNAIAVGIDMKPRFNVLVQGQFIRACCTILVVARGVMWARGADDSVWRACVECCLCSTTSTQANKSHTKKFVLDLHICNTCGRWEVQGVHSARQTVHSLVQLAEV